MEQEGAYRLPEAQLDCFLMHVVISYPNEETEGEIIKLNREENAQAPKAAASGTTGFPKGVMLTHRNLTANIVQVEGVFRCDEGDVLLAVLPYFHIYGLTVNMNFALPAARPSSRWRASTWRRSSRRSSATA